MKKKALSYYLDLIKSAQDKEEWAKVASHGEKALKKIAALSYLPFEEYLLYCRIGFAYNELGEYSSSLNAFYKAYLVSTKHNLTPSFIAYTHFEIGYNLMRQYNISHASRQFNKVNEYYQKHGYNAQPMDKEKYLYTLMGLGYCYLHQNKPAQVKEIIDNKLSGISLSLYGESFLITYRHFKGEYFMAIKEYNEARKSFEECLNIREKYNFSRIGLEVKIHLAVISLLEKSLESAINTLETLLKDKQFLKFNELICEAGLLLSKCYLLNDMPDKTRSIEKRIKPLLNKLDITWLYETTREFEQLYRRLQPVYNTNNAGHEPVPAILRNTLNQQSERLPYKIIGNAASIREVYRLIEKIAPTDLPVLIQGETGTGKELVARNIYQNSTRGEKVWLAVNCGALPETLLENEIFGCAKGAFTDAKEDRKGYIELASEGTLFLDEIAEMSPAMQQKLLRILEEKLVWRIGGEKPIPVNTRFIFASNRNIEELVKAKKFREDLYYRINTIVITLPPLRDRKDDMPLLVKHFLNKYTVSPKSEILNPNSEIEVIPDALSIFVDYNWPGNVRELENEVKRICTLYPDIKQITPSVLSDSIRYYTPVILSQPKDGLTLKESKEIFERNLIIETLKKYNGNISQTAQQLGFSWFGLQRKMKQLKIQHCQYVTKK